LNGDLRIALKNFLAFLVAYLTAATAADIYLFATGGIEAVRVFIILLVFRSVVCMGGFLIPIPASSLFNKAAFHGVMFQLMVNFCDPRVI
jgi:hypothetical protein